jgi:hypothetical protein
LTDRCWKAPQQLLLPAAVQGRRPRCSRSRYRAASSWLHRPHHHLQQQPKHLGIQAAEASRVHCQGPQAAKPGSRLARRLRHLMDQSQVAHAVPAFSQHNPGRGLEQPAVLCGRLWRLGRC